MASIDRVAKLDENTSTKIRQTQIITKISDVVRELIDNSVDAKANSIIVSLENYGIDKIEVRDSGEGISSTDFQLAIAGGHTSKLKNDNHISSHKEYGFRGEALSSICSTANVTISTKTKDEAEGRRYFLNQKEEITSETKAAIGTGTTTTVKDLFCKIPVRRKFISEIKRKTAELKEIETFMKSMAIANFRVHFSLYHDGNLSWTKPSVTSMDQSLVTVMGVVTAKKLTRYGPVNIFDDEPEANGTNTQKRKGKMELFLPKSPVDYKTMSYTANKMAMIFVNRRRVYIREFEKIIQRYVAAVSAKPAPADNHRYPVSVLSLDVPPIEVDFNRDMDKTKVFLTYKDEVAKKLEEILMKFYGVTLLNSQSNVANDGRTEGETSPIKHVDLDKNDDVTNSVESILPNIVIKSPQSTDAAPIVTHPVLTAGDTTKSTPSRNDNILAFLGSMHTVCNTNFTKSPSKNAEKSAPEESPNKSLPVPAMTPNSSSLFNRSDFNNFLNTQKDVTPIQRQDKELEGITSTKRLSPTAVSNFEINISLDSLDESQPPPSKKIRNDDIDAEKWLQGRLQDKFGGIIENVAIVRGPVATETKASNHCIKNVTPTSHSSSFQCGSGFSEHTVGTSESSRKTGRNVTLDYLKNWKTSDRQGSVKSNLTLDPSQPKMTEIFSKVSNKSASEQSLGKQKSELSMTATILEPSEPKSPIGVAPKSVQDYLDKSLYVSQVVASYAGLTETVNLKNYFTLNNSDKKTPSEEETPALPKIVGNLPGKNLYIATINGYLGAFSPSAFLYHFPELKTKYQENELSMVTKEECVSSLLVDFAATTSEITQEIYKQIFHVLKDLDALNFQPCISSTQYSTLSKA